MRLLRIISNQGIRPAYLDAAGVRRDLSPLLPDINAEVLSTGQLAKLKPAALGTLAVLSDDLPLAPCLGGIGKIVCIGKNYPEHAKETGSSSPTEPILFLKALSALSGANDPIIMPRGAEKLDWEVELGVIIGTHGSYIEEKNALDHVAGYCTADDVSERAYQTERAGQWTKGKSADSFGPIGPWFVTKDEIPDPQNLNLWTEVNGQRMQDGNTRDMTFKIPFLIHYISQFMSLHPGDVILTGTPSGVAKGMTPPRYLKVGDKLRLNVEGLGVQEHTIIASR
jgi:2-keto-4-pentenoate hydratase/2-oxohepta-3-ene-1,7-dioic acid hydratase in catechol pathway